jgi:hypothetical protein
VSAGLVVRLGKVFYGSRKPSTLRIPGSVREIEDNVFSQFTWLIDLSVEEGILKIGVPIFTGCSKLKKASVPASLTVIDANAFQGCKGLRQISFAVGSQLQYIRSEALSDSPLNKAVGPASIVEIDVSAFSDEVWRKCVRFEDSPFFLIDDRFILLVDPRVIIRFVSSSPQAFVGANIEMISIYIVGDHRDSTICYNSCVKFV